MQPDITIMGTQRLEITLIQEDEDNSSLLLD